MMMLKITTPAPPKEGNFHALVPFKGLAKTSKRNIPLPPSKGELGTLFVIESL